MQVAYKAVRLDKTSHYDQKTKWRTGNIVRPDRAGGAEEGHCGHGIHCSPTLLHAVGLQGGPSLYAVVEPRGIIASDETKMRCECVKVLRWLTQQEQDQLAEFKLWEANHPINPLMLPGPNQITKAQLRDLAKWASVRASVRASAGDSVCASVWDSVWDSVWASVWASVWTGVGDSVRANMWASVRAGVWDSAGDSVGAYAGGLFPRIRIWKYAEELGPHPWNPLLRLWYAGIVPSFDGNEWRLHAGPKAAIIWQGSV